MTQEARVFADLSTVLPVRQRVLRRIIVICALVLSATSCAIDHDWTVAEGLTPTINEQTAPPAAEDLPAELAFVDEAEEHDPTPSLAFCDASADAWVHSAVLNLLDPQSSTEARQVALANAAEHLERAATFDEVGVTSRAAMFDAFTTLRTIADDVYESNWLAYSATTDFANNANAMVYEAEREALVSFLNDECTDVRVVDLRHEALDLAEALATEYAVAASTVVESDALPGQLIFTHSSGRLIASFPSAWDYEDRLSTGVAELVAAPDIDRFLAGDAIDGVHYQLTEVATEAEFRTLIDATRTATTCWRTNNVTDGGATRVNITQTYECSDHAATVIGQYSSERGAGLIIEASFDRVEASRADLIRLGSMANSALWS